MSAGYFPLHRSTADGPNFRRKQCPRLYHRQPVVVNRRGRRSTPAAADIEIDGGFVGSTPSTVGVAAGQHQISVKKSGFKPCERKITVSSGQVNVNAVLESDLKSKDSGPSNV
jgi:hypothetical protein